MDGKRKRLMLIILTMESEMLIGSTVLFLKYYLYKRARIGFDLIVIDNCSKDRTLITAQKAGAEVLCLNERYEWREVVRTALDIGKESLARTIVILDLTGGNDAEDAISLISRSLKEDERFASGYIAPIKGPGSIGCWALDRGMLDIVDGGIEFDVEKKLMELATDEDMEILAVNERFLLNRKRQKREYFAMFRRSPLHALSALVRYHPLTFYGSIGLVMLLFALGSGFYTIDYFYAEGELNYFPAFTTVALVMIGGFFMVAGLMLNALNVLAERIEAMKKWLE